MIQTRPFFHPFDELQGVRLQPIIQFTILQKALSSINKLNLSAIEDGGVWVFEPSHLGSVLLIMIEELKQHSVTYIHLWDLGTDQAVSVSLLTGYGFHLCLRNDPV